MRIVDHPILGKLKPRKEVTIEVDGKKIPAYEGEPIAAALMAQGIKVFRISPKYSQPKGVFCAIGRCTDCMMTVNGIPNVRTCVTLIKDGMKIFTQRGLGEWRERS